MMASWATRTSLRHLDEELEACYTNAKEFLLQLGNLLVSDHNWHQEPDIDVSCSLGPLHCILSA